ncbi:type IV pilus modification protein PilV [Variovorax paradoxus]|uniref:type IV pilus modification protein PilV n=1 Tax=Variovorax paradoxus TaxID=34073 RepID=UPI0021ACDE0E|nr:type IV pilus modification protein PilV [Variovorax paradoxus]UVH60090.1 type IV pilus modification protein PilV [Variovorax paradoxus]
MLSVPIRKAHRERKGQAGFSMIEAMVAVLVLSFGLLALAGFQLRVLADSAGASSKNIAVQLAGDMADRIRANLIAGAASDSPYVANWSTASVTAPEPPCTGASATCSAAQLAANDLWNWKRTVAAALPGGQADIQGKATAGGLLFVHIAWDEPAVVNPIAPNSDWDCPSGKACMEVVVAVPQP